MATVPSPTAGRFQADLRAALSTAAKSNVTKTRAAKSSYFAKWTAFCAELGHDPALRRIKNNEDKISYLLVFSLRYRRRPGKGGKSVRAGSISKILTAVGQGVTHLGVPDFRFPSFGSRHYYPILSDFMAALRKEDDPTSRAYPVNTIILRALQDVLDTEHWKWGPLNALVIDLAIVGFFFLLRSAEYLKGPSDPEAQRSQAFRFMDIQFDLAGAVYLAHLAPLNDARAVLRIRHAWLTLGDQKNAVRGELVGHKATDDPFFCPAKALGRIAHRLRRLKAPPETPIANHYNPVTKKWYPTTSTHMTTALRHAAAACEAKTGISPSLISSRSLRPGGATALLMAGVDSDHICLVGRWRSDAMFRYLRIQAATTRQSYAQRMLDHGDYTFAPAAFQQGNALPREAPARFHQLLEHSELYDSDSDSDSD